MLFVQRFGHALESFGNTSCESHDLLRLGGRLGLGLAMGAGLALLGLILWLFV